MPQHAAWPPVPAALLLRRLAAAALLPPAASCSCCPAGAAGPVAAVKHLLSADSSCAVGTWLLLPAASAAAAAGPALHGSRLLVLLRLGSGRSGRLLLGMSSTSAGGSVGHGADSCHMRTCRQPAAAIAGGVPMLVKSLSTDCSHAWPSCVPVVWVISRLAASSCPKV
jgi:hypothetical protein